MLDSQNVRTNGIFSYPSGLGLSAINARTERDATLHLEDMMEAPVACDTSE